MEFGDCAEVVAAMAFAEGAGGRLDGGRSAFGQRDAIALLQVGETAHEYGVGANEAGLSKQNVETFSQDELPALAAFLRKQTQPGDVVLIKGSRALALERLLPLFKQADV